MHMTENELAAILQGLATPGPDIRRQPRPVIRPQYSEKLPPGPWRSLGGFLNYETWEERDRFIELDEVLSRQCGGADSSLVN